MWRFYQYQTAFILHLDIILFSYTQVIKELMTQTVQCTMLKWVLVLISNLHLHSQAHIALSFTNKVSHSICIWLRSSSGAISMSYANIVHSNSPSNYGVVYVEVAGARKMMYCIFKNNQNYLFCVWSGSLEVSHSFIDHSASFLTSTAVSTSNNNSFTNTKIFYIQLFNSHYCNTDNQIELPQETQKYPTKKEIHK